MPGLRWEFSAPNALGNVALGLPFSACTNHNSQIIFYFLFKTFISTATPLPVLIPFFPTALNCGGSSPGHHTGNSPVLGVEAPPGSRESFPLARRGWQPHPGREGPDPPRNKSLELWELSRAAPPAQARGSALHKPRCGICSFPAPAIQSSAVPVVPGAQGRL